MTVQRRITPVLQKSASESSSSVERACRVLRALSDPQVERLTDIAQATKLSKTTVLRVLDVLLTEGLVSRDEATKRYRLGPELQVLGSTVLRRFDPRPFVQPALRRLAGQFEDSVMLSLPSGVESVCVDFVEGTFPIRSNYQGVGSRRPLGVGAGGLALLAWLPADMQRAALQVIGPQLRRFPRINVQVLEQHAAESRERGYAVMLDLALDRWGGIAVPLLGADGLPVAAIAVGALSERIRSREAQLAKMLKRECTQCQVLWSGALAGLTTWKSRSRA
ncbi:IclR family transcriptional regulator [Pseudorhodoferax sp.]|uniref:IclR family transcriptional regulator n=1 Tax=Pseudorhodoferax sp. TaxID=1993553 RepID=UPI002DD6338D|nr:IclR family transcriptional regulator [Pseudorhodoferax sp.]